MTKRFSRRADSKLLVPETPRLIKPEEVSSARPNFDDAIRHGNLDGEFKFLTFAGILPLNLPDGTKVAVIPDIHVPAHDEKVVWALKLALRDYQPDILIFIGDVADCFSISAWPADPSVRKNINEELIKTRELIDDFRECSGAKWVFIIMGNHEDRLARFLMNHAPQLANIINPLTGEKSLSIPDLLGYGPSDNVTFIYDLAERGGFGGGILANGCFKWHHGRIVRPRPGASPRADADTSGRSTEHGHTHRLGFSVREQNFGEIVASEIGHLIREDHPYVDYSNLMNNHHQGFATALVHNGKVHSELHPIYTLEVEGKRRKVFTLNGKTYYSADR